MQYLGSRIRMARELKGYSQAQLSHALGSTSTSLVTNWERGISKPDVDKLTRLCQILETNPAFILGLVEPELEFSKEDLSLIKKLHSIDEYGLSLVTTVINHEYQRCKSRPNPKAFPQKDNELLPFFLLAKDPRYDTMKKKATALSGLKKDVGASIDGILRFLWSAGYSNLSLVDVLLILDGKKVPSPKLYAYIYAYLTKKYEVKLDEDLLIESE